MLTKETKPIFLLLFSLFIVNIGTTQINIDGYNDGQQPLVLINTSSPSSGSSSLTTAAALGGERDIEMTINTGPTNSVGITSIVGDQISVAFPLNTTGEVFLTWDGVDGMAERSNIDFTGLGGVDLTATGGSNNRIVINDVASDYDFTFVLTVYSDGVNFSTVTQAVTGGNPDENILLPLNSFTVAGGVGADFTNVGAITLEIQVDASSQANDIDLGTIFVESAGPPPAPEMIVFQDDGDDTEIPSGDMTPTSQKGTDFGTTNVSDGVTVRLLTIENTGNADLLLTGNPLIEITGPGADQFTVDQQPSTTISGGGTTTFRILFDPADDACGQSDATVSIANNDSDENPYTFAITANGIDNLDPTIDCSAIDVTRDNDAGDCAAVVNYDPATATDNCDMMVDITYSQNAGTSFDVGSTTVTATATDDETNTATCSFNVTVNDTENPTANCPGTQTVGNDAGQCGANVNFSIPNPTDNCPGATSTENLSSGSFFDVGATTVTVTATDASSNTGTCTFSVVVNDTEPPVFTSCPNDIEVNNDAGQCGAIVNYDVAYTENCAFGSVVFEQTAGQGIGTLFPVGITTNTFTLTDASGNTATPCTFNVIVNDTENPTANCPGTQTVDNDPGICGANVSFSIPNPSDNCPGATSMANPASGSLFNVGTTPVTVTATDATGNTSECTFDVVVNDTEAPTMMCNSFDVTLVGNSATITTSQMDGGSTDNCGIISLVAIPSSFNCSTLGAQTVSLTGTDAGGNSSTCTGTVTVIANNPPTAICATNPTVNLASDGTTTVAASFFDGGSSAVCGGVTFMADMTDFDCDDVGNTIPVVLTVTATSNSQTATCTAMVTVEDPQSFCCAPANAVCNNFEVALGSNGMVTIDPSNVGGGSTAECGLMSETVMPNMFDCDDAGTTTSVTYTIVDINGESSNCMANVTITSVAPEVPTADVTMAMGCAGVTGGDVSVVDPMNGDLEVSWLVLEVPMGATITMDDILAPGTADSHYRTTVPGEPYTLRIKSNNSVTTGTYSFKAFFTNTATGCVSDNTTEEFTVVINDLPADPVAVQMSSEFCSNSGVGNGQKRVRIEAPAGANEGTIWILTDAPTGSQFDGMEPIEFAEGESNSEFRVTGGSKGNTVTMRGEPDNNGTPVYGTWTFDVRVEDSNTGCSSGTETGYFITAFENPADPVAATATKAFCVNPDLSANLANTGINVSNSLSANEKVVWVMTSAPANSPYSVETQLTTDDCGDAFKNFGTFAVANTSKVLRVNDIANAVPGTYTFDAYIENCETGCVSELTSGFSITVNEMPSVMITADLPIGIGRDLCLGQEDVQYNAVVTSTDGGTYSYLWCAYNSGDGSGSCFNGFDNNTAQDPMRDWTSSAGAKSVGVTATSDVAGCEAEDLYSFEVVAPTMVECPDDIMATLETDPMTYDCTTDITFNHPMVEAGACDPVNLTLEITGPSGAGPEMVTPGEEYVFSVVELGEYTVTYNLSDAVGNTSSCSFKITVDGLLCGWVDNGGIGDCAGENASDYDQDTETYMVSSNGCVPAFPYTGDNQAFINTQLCGDGYIEVFVDNITAKGFAGISLRESQAAGAKKVEIGTDNVARIIRAARVIDGYPAFPQELISFDKFWLKIERTGNSFRASASTDGVSYTPYLFQTIMMGECLEAGLWAYSTNPEDVVTATFNNVTVVEYGGDNLQAPVTNLAQSQTDLGAFDVSLTPNPAKEQVTLNLEQLIGQEVMIRLYNINGQLMQQQPIEAVGTATHRLDLSNLPQGAYWVQVQSASGQKTMKLIKQ